ncbi:MAG: Hsp70 family protein [Thermoguttaceae bacterium]|jgi:molecular chaperone DnaK (HSP70)|nr:Hsp70 family protein [Thermoguttaceae bacterium]
MPGRLGVDFGTSNTVLAVWDDSRGEAVPLALADYAAPRVQASEGVATEPVPTIPSLIHYGPQNTRWIGAQVAGRNLGHSERTFRFMKRYIANRSLVQVRVDGKPISHFDAGRDFLAAVLGMAATELGLADEEIGVTVPVEAYEHYEDWLLGVAEAAGMRRVRLIDEPSAAALGYGAHIQPGHLYLIFDFGGGTLDVSVVCIEEADAAATGRRCRVLGKAGTPLGGVTIDQWLFQEVLRQSGRSDGDAEVRRVSGLLLTECEQAKIRLSLEDRADITVVDPQTGAVLAAEFTRDTFEELLDRHEALRRVDETIRRALNDARERGYTEDDLNAVLLVGGSSAMPCVRRTVQRIFGRERVRLDRPFDAVARGAAALVAGVDFFDHIQHSYAIRHVDSRKGHYSYRELVKRGTPYPTKEPLARLTIKASHKGQTQLGLAIFELGEQHRPSAGRPVELVFDPSGAARLAEVTPDDEQRRAQFWINEQNPTFLRADPPAAQGEPCFEVESGVDANKRLLITARDLRTGKLTHRDYPVVKLT